MCDYPTQVKCPRVARITVADRPVEPFRIRQPAGAMVGHRGCERLLRTAAGIHDDVPKTNAVRPAQSQER
jgi:hypothetical protein